MSKMQKQPYKKRYANLIETIEKGLPAFEQLTEMEQSKILIGFVFNISKSQKMDLRLIGGSKDAGISRGTVKISNYNEVKLIVQSVTGLFVFEKNLLKL